MDKWEELKQNIRWRIGFAETLACRSAANKEWEFYAEHQGRGNELRAILVIMDGLEEELAPERPQAHSQEFSGPGIGE